MRGLVPQLHQLYHRFREQVCFVTIYIKEAHSIDGWPIGSRFSHAQPTTTTERLVLAKQLQKEFAFEIPILIDPPEKQDAFEAAYAPWPLRFFVVSSSPSRRLTYIAQPLQGSFLVSSLEAALLQVIQPQPQQNQSL